MPVKCPCCAVWEMIQDPISKRWYSGKAVMTQEDLDNLRDKGDKAFRQMRWMHQHPRLDTIRRFFGLPTPQSYREDVSP